MTAFGICLRCGRVALEHLTTHSYCWECNYSPVTDPELAQWAAIEYRPRKPTRTHSTQTSRWFTARPLRGIGYGGIV